MCVLKIFIKKHPFVSTASHKLAYKCTPKFTKRLPLHMKVLKGTLHRPECTFNICFHTQKSEIEEFTVLGFGEENQSGLAGLFI